MYYLNVDEASKKPFYTWEDYQYDKKNNPTKKETFAMVYWKSIEESLLGHEIEIPVGFCDKMNFFDSMMEYMEYVFGEARNNAEDPVQLYLREHNYTIDQWPDPCLPVLFRTKNPYNFFGDPPEGKYGYGDGFMFNEADFDGFVFHYFGEKHKAKRFSERSGISWVDMDYTVYLPPEYLKNWSVGEISIEDGKKWKHIQFPEVKKYENELKVVNKKIDSLFANVHKREEYENARENLGKAYRENSEEAKALAWTGFLPKARWLILFLLGILLLGIPAVSLWLHVTGNLFEPTFGPVYEKLAGIPRYIIGLYYAFFFGICSILETIHGKAYWIIEGILFLAVLIYMIVICDQPGCMLGKKYRKYKKIRKQYEQNIKKAQKETKEPGKEYERGAEMVKLSAPYLEAVAEKEEVERKLAAAQKVEKEMCKYYGEIAKSWHNRWLNLYRERGPKMPTKKDREGYKVVYIKPVAKKD